MHEITANVGKLVYIRATNDLDIISKRIREKEAEIKVLKDAREENTQIIVQFDKYVCRHCRGRGEHWVSYAQDDTKMEVCKTCNGTGLSKDYI